MLFFYYGEDSFRAHQKIQAIVKKFKDKIDPSGQNIQHLDGETITADDFFKAVSVMGFLADKKLIIIKNIFDNKKLTTWQDILIKFLDKQNDTPDENYLVFWQGGKADSRKKIFKRLNKLKFSEEFSKQNPRQLSQWITRHAQAQKKHITPAAVELLISYVGNDLWQLHQEISKLAHFSEEDINDKDVREIVQAKIDDNIFNMIDALGNKDKALTLKLIEEKLNHGVNHQYILTMIIRQFRILIKAKALSKDTKYASALAQALKIPPRIAEKTLAQSKEYSADELKKIYSHLLLLDEKFKTTQNQEKILFTQMIHNL
ncbi:DNA polymerase III subunit delta [Candidatus Parcubacteria bacterium]|jgi:DNA polymerase III subunit delta|nr:DNA polymerase III subunit delta [Candidatus Parcubacteria bacterium]